MKERILVYKSIEFDRIKSLYKLYLKDVQKLVQGIQSLGIEPTAEQLRILLQGGCISDQVAKADLPEEFAKFPKAMKEGLIKMYKEENENEYLEKVGNLAAELTEANRTNDLINFSFFSVKDGKAILLDDYLKDLEDQYCVFADTQVKKAIYDKWIKFKAAADEFNQAVQEAPKREATALERSSSRMSLPDQLKGLGTSSDFCLVSVYGDDEGDEIKLNGENFEYFK